MIQQIALGTLLIIATVLVHAVATWVAFHVAVRMHTEGWDLTSLWKSTWLTATLVVCMFAVAIFEAFLWAATYVAVGAFEGLEPAFYFSLVVFTTLGFGDVVLDPSWRILSAIEAANGVMMFGWTTALIFWFMQRVVRHVFHPAEEKAKIHGGADDNTDRSGRDLS